MNRKPPVSIVYVHVTVFRARARKTVTCTKKWSQQLLSLSGSAGSRFSPPTHERLRSCDSGDLSDRGCSSL